MRIFWEYQGSNKSPWELHRNINGKHDRRGPGHDPSEKVNLTELFVNDDFYFMCKIKFMMGGSST